MYRMKTRVLIFLFMLCSLSLGAQIRLEGYRQTDINPELLTGRWKARWISLPMCMVSTTCARHSNWTKSHPALLFM